MTALFDRQNERRSDAQKGPFFHRRRGRTFDGPSTALQRPFNGVTPGVE